MVVLLFLLLVYFILHILSFIVGTVLAAEFFTLQDVFVARPNGLETHTFFYRNGNMIPFMLPTSEFAIQTVDEFICKTPSNECMNFILNFHTSPARFTAATNLFLRTSVCLGLTAFIVPIVPIVSSLYGFFSFI